MEKLPELKSMTDQEGDPGRPHLESIDFNSQRHRAFTFLDVSLANSVLKKNIRFGQVTLETS
jgi:hypothetical protein